MNKLVSIIVPVYNLAEYLDISLSSLLNQTYKNIEIIVVDDGSTDDSQEVLKKYATDKRMKIYRKKNEGLSSARNYGLEKSNGTYIYFFDGDDAIHPSIIELGVSILEEHNLDVFSFKSRDVFVKEDLIQFENSAPTSLLSHQVDFNFFAEHVVYQDLVRYEVWTKIFKKDLLKDLKFKVGQPFEDVYFNLEVLKQSPRYMASEYVGHHYLKLRAGNTNSKRFSMTRLWVYDEFDQWLLFIDSESIRNNFISAILKFSFGQYQLFKNNKYHRSLFHLQYSKYFSISRIIASNNSVVKKIALILFRFIPGIISNFYKVR